MKKDKMLACSGIIHGASAATAAVGAGLAQIPSGDSLVIAPIQIAMIMSLGKVFGIDLDQSAAKSMVISGAASMVGRTASQLLIGWIPGAGNIINATTAAGITESIGWFVVDEFDRQCAMED